MASTPQTDMENAGFNMSVHRYQMNLPAWCIPVSHRIARFLERQGLLERDMEQSYLALEEDDDLMISYTWK